MTTRDPEVRSAPAVDGPEPPFENEILIAPDGTVLFRHLDEALLPLAAELDPRDERISAVLRGFRR